MASPAKTVVVAEADLEDRARVVEIISELASEAGIAIELHETDDGEDADRLIAEADPDLVVCEILLNNISGLELLRKQRARRGDEAVPFIFVTHMTAETDRYWGLRNGAFAYVMKPYEPSILERRVRKVLAKTNGEQASAKPKVVASSKSKPPPVKAVKKTGSAKPQAPKVEASANKTKPPKVTSKTPPPPKTKS